MDPYRAPSTALRASYRVRSSRGFLGPVILFGLLSCVALVAVAFGTIAKLAVLLPAMFMVVSWRDRKYHILAVPGGAATLRAFDDRLELEPEGGKLQLSSSELADAGGTPRTNHEVRFGYSRVHLLGERHVTLSNAGRIIHLSPRMFEDPSDFLSFVEYCKAMQPATDGDGDQASAKNDGYLGQLRDELSRMDGLD